MKWTWIWRLLGIKHCLICGSVDLLHRTNLNGGWNNLCNQATGRAGWNCYDCGDIVWDLTEDEYSKQLPHWCESYRDRALKRKS